MELIKRILNFQIDSNFQNYLVTGKLCRLRECREPVCYVRLLRSREYQEFAWAPSEGMMKRLLSGVCASVLWFALPSVNAIAQSMAAARTEASTDYPRRTIRLLVPFAPGGGTDIIARVTAQKVSDAWGQAIVV